MEMEIRGIVNTQVGSGTYIANRNANRADETEKIKKKMEELILDLLKRAKVLGLDRDDIIEMLKKMGDR
jgi:DNA-binding transcriptional regulator YhcF (GntR family)